jgi:4-hydroxybenzoyl-CoA thioesterase
MSSPKTHIHRVDVHFGDCDPAGIVFFPNFSRWMDQASLAYFMACGVPPWRELEATRGIVGTPLLEIHTRFLRPATYGQKLEVHTSVVEWREKVLIQQHRIMRDDELLCEGRETRAFVVRLPGSYKLKSIPIPEDIKALCV